MNLLSYRSFSTELMKIASGLLDSDIRRLLAERAGDEEYLEGGELPANAPPMEKNAFLDYVPPSTYNVRGKKPTGEGEPYEVGSSFASSALKGGMTGGGVYALQNNLRHGFGKGFREHMTRKGLATVMALGAGIAAGDRALRRQAAKQKKKKQQEPKHEKHAALSSDGTSFYTPGAKLRKGPVQIGRKFSLPRI